MFTRRDFIKTMSLLSGAVLAPVHWLGKWARVQPAETNEPPDVGKLYAGFVLLSDGDPVPGFVRSPRRKIPILCNVGGNVEITGVIEEFNDVEEVISKLKFLIYKLAPPMSPVGGYVLSHKSGEIFGVEQVFSEPQGVNDENDPKVSLWIEPDFPYPKPIWTIEPVEPGGAALTLEKVDFLPVPGVMAISPYERQFHWIENNLYYNLIIRESPTLDVSKALIDLLFKVN